MKTYWHRRANISIGTVTTLEPGSDATASVTEDNVLSLGIPQGAQGEQGIQGPPMTYDDMSAADKAALAGEVADDLPFASTGGHGVVQIGSGLSVDADGVLSATGVESPEMTGATASTAGTGGTVPAPAAGKQNSFLRGDATWATPPYPSNATTSAAGLMSAADKTKLDGIDYTLTLIYENDLVNQLSSLYEEIDSIEGFDGIIIQYCSTTLSSKSFTGGVLYNGPMDTKKIYFDGLGIMEYLQYERTYQYHSIGNRIRTTLLRTRLNGQDLTSNKIACREFSIEWIADINMDRSITEKFMLNTDEAYYNGSKNNAYCIPYKIYGFKQGVATT